MLPRSSRLPSSAMRPKGGHRVSFPSFAVRIAKNSGPSNRFAFIISSKVEPLSTKRHVLKRLLGETVRNWPVFSLDFIFILQSGIKKRTKNEVLADLEEVRKAAQNLK